MNCIRILYGKSPFRACPDVSGDGVEKEYDNAIMHECENARINE